jgi:MFS family permease
MNKKSVSAVLQQEPGVLRPGPSVSRNGLSLGLTVMVGLAIMFNYIDRGAISIAAPLIKDEMGLTATGYGFVVSSFFWTYVPVLLIAGWLADRISVHWLMGGGVALWAIATFATGFTDGLVSLVAMRVVMGIGEGVAFPSGSKLLARAPENRRSTANISLAAGLGAGPLVGTLAGAAVLERYGWRAMFIVFGLVTLLWLLPWSRLGREVDAPAAGDGGAACAYPAMLRRSELWSISMLHFTGTYCLYFFIAWLPLYLVKVRGYDITQMALLTALFYLGQTVGAFVSGGLVDWIIARGGDCGRVRRAGTIFGFTFAAIGVGALALTGSTWSLIAWLVPTSLVFGSNTGLLFTIGQTLAGPASAGRWIGVQSSIGNFAGIFGPVITGMIVDDAGYMPAFYLTTAIGLAGVVVFMFGVTKVAPVQWARA